MINGFDEETLCSHIPEEDHFMLSTRVMTLERSIAVKPGGESLWLQFYLGLPGQQFVRVNGADV